MDDAALRPEDFYEHNAVACTRCHQIGGDAGQCGPEVGRVAGRTTREYLLESVVAPKPAGGAGIRAR